MPYARAFISVVCPKRLAFDLFAHYLDARYGLG